MIDDFTLAFEERVGYVLCTYAGPFSAPPLIEASARIAAYCSERDHRRVLVDFRQSVGDLTVDDRYLIANNVRFHSPSSTRIAICIREDQGDKSRTWTSVMTAHGFAAESFRDLPAAIAWLLAQPA